MNSENLSPSQNLLKWLFLGQNLKKKLKNDLKRILFNLNENGGNAVNIHRHYKSLIDRGGYVKACFLLQYRNIM